MTLKFVWCWRSNTGCIFFFYLSFAAVMPAVMHMEPLSTGNLESLFLLQFNVTLFHGTPSKYWPRDSEQVLHLLKIFLDIWESSCHVMLVVSLWISSFRSYKEFRLSVASLTHNNCLGLSLEILRGHSPLVISHLPNAFAREAIGNLAVWAMALPWIK